MQRISIVGSAGSGKSTLAGVLCARLHSPLVELDELYWRPGWQPTPAEEFQAKVAAALADERWVVCGHYRSVRDLVWGRADTVIWLDYPLPLCFARLLRRTWQRVVTQETLWGGNRESWRTQLLSRESLLLYTLRTHRRRQREIAAQLAGPAYAHLAVLRLRRSQEAAALLETLAAAGNAPAERGGV
jgi:adenylate kinase family enzyme